MNLKYFPVQFIGEKEFDLDYFEKVKNEVINEAYLKFKTLKKIIISEKEPIFSSRIIPELKGWRKVTKNITKNGACKAGGCVHVYKKGEQYSFVIWVNKIQLFYPSDEIILELNSLLHELGHINDLEFGGNFDLIFKTSIKIQDINNLAVLELNAHLYVCKKLIEYKLKKSMRGYILNLLFERSGKITHNSIAANKFFKEDSVKLFCDFADIKVTP